MMPTFLKVEVDSASGPRVILVNPAHIVRVETDKHPRYTHYSLFMSYQNGSAHHFLTEKGFRDLCEALGVDPRELL